MRPFNVASLAAFFALLGPGCCCLSVQAATLTLKNDLVTVTWKTHDRMLWPDSLMLHGIIYARYAHGLNTDTNGVFKSEVRAFFGSGTQLQEMYITPSLLTAENWDTLAGAAKWSRANAGTLLDTHWVGGSPAERRVYGWAAWSPIIEALPVQE